MSRKQETPDGTIIEWDQIEFEANHEPTVIIKIPGDDVTIKMKVIVGLIEKAMNVVDQYGKPIYNIPLQNQFMVITPKGYKEPNLPRIGSPYKKEDFEKGGVRETLGYR